MAQIQKNGGSVSGNASIVTSLPSATTVGNTILIFVNSASTLSTPSGFVSRSPQVNIQGCYLFEKLVASGNSSDTPTLTMSGAYNATWQIVEESNITAFDVSSGNNGGFGVINPIATPSITPTTGDRKLFAYVAATGNGSSANFGASDPTSWANSFAGQKSNVVAYSAGSGRDPTAGGFADRSLTANGSTSYSTSASVTNGGSYAPATIIASYKVSAGGTSVNIAGASCSAVAGGVSNQVSDSVSITGASCSALAGTVGGSIGDSISITGASCAAVAGGVTTAVSDSTSIIGAAASALAGIVTTEISGSVSISGAAAAALAGLLVSEVDAALSGASASALAGDLAPSVTGGVTGAAAQALAGNVAASGGTTVDISGASVAALAGTAAVLEAVGIAGAEAQAIAGDVSTSAGGGATVNITGAHCAAVAGDVAPTGLYGIAGAAVAAEAGNVTESVAVPTPGAACAALAGSVIEAVASLATGAMAAALAGALAAGLLVPTDGAQATALAGGVEVHSSSQLAISGASAQAIAGTVTPRVTNLRLNPNYIGAAFPRVMVAAVPEILPIVAATPRNRIVVGVANQMAQTNDLAPPIDATVEEETVTFDYGPILASGVSIVSIVSVTCALVSGVDDNPSSRLIDDPQLAPSPNTGAANTAVLQLVGTMIGGATYRLQCVVTTSDGQKPSLWTHLACITPN